MMEIDEISSWGVAYFQTRLDVEMWIYLGAFLLAQQICFGMDLNHNKNIIQMEKATQIVDIIYILMDIETLWQNNQRRTCFR